VTDPGASRATAAALLSGSDLTTHTSVKGDPGPALHPVVQRFLDELPVEQRERYAGRCAEAVVVSDRLRHLEATSGEILSAIPARAALWGARLTVVAVREPEDPTHRSQLVPCRSCAALLEWLGIELVTETATG